MKRIYLYLGKVGSGKSHIARQQYELMEELGKEPFYIEVSALVTDFAKKITGKENLSREELQGVKAQMKNDPNWLLDSIIEQIESVSTNTIVLSGLREKWIYDKLVEKYGKMRVTIVEADSELRRNRRELSSEQFKAAEERDNQIGLGELLESVGDHAVVVENNYEYTS